MTETVKIEKVPYALKTWLDTLASSSRARDLRAVMRQTMVPRQSSPDWNPILQEASRTAKSIVNRTKVRAKKHLLAIDHVVIYWNYIGRCLFHAYSNAQPSAGCRHLLLDCKIDYYIEDHPHPVTHALVPQGRHEVHMAGITLTSSPIQLTNPGLSISVYKGIDSELCSKRRIYRILEDQAILALISDILYNRKKYISVILRTGKVFIIPECPQLNIRRKYDFNKE